MVADIDVFTTVITDGKAKAFAAASQPGLDHVRIVGPLDRAFLRTGDHTKFFKPLNGELQGVFFRTVAQSEDLFECFGFN